MVDNVGLCLVVPASLILVVHLTYASREQFYAGNDSISGTVISLTALSIFHPRTTSEMDHYVSEAVAIWIACLLVILVIAVCRHSVQARFLGLSFALNVLLLVAGHYTIRLKYPE